MKIEVGNKIRGMFEIVWVSEDKRVFGVLHKDDLGAKGRIWGKMIFQKLSDADIEEFHSARIQIAQFDGVWYSLLEYVEEAIQIVNRCIWYTTDKSSAYAYPEPIIMET